MDAFNVSMHLFRVLWSTPTYICRLSLQTLFMLLNLVFQLRLISFFISFFKTRTIAYPLYSSDSLLYLEALLLFSPFLQHFFASKEEDNFLIFNKTLLLDHLKQIWLILVLYDSFLFNHSFFVSIVDLDVMIFFVGIEVFIQFCLNFILGFIHPFLTFFSACLIFIWVVPLYLLLVEKLMILVWLSLFFHGSILG